MLFFRQCKIFKDGNAIGAVTSGTVSPILEKGIGLGYVEKEFAKFGTEIDIEVRNKMISAEIIKPPSRKVKIKSLISTGCSELQPVRRRIKRQSPVCVCLRDSL